MTLNHYANRGNLNDMYKGIIYQYRIQASLKNGWAVEGKHFKYISHDNPVLSEMEV